MGKLSLCQLCKNQLDSSHEGLFFTYTNSLLTSLTYNDGTPGIAYNYDAFDTDDNHVPGDLETVTRDGRTWTYKYNSSTLRPLSETQPVGGTAIERVLTRSFDAYGRPDGFQLGTSTDPDLDHAVSYGLDNSGRYGQIAAAGKTFSYTYTPHSQHLIETVQGPADILVTNTWDENRDVLFEKDNTVDSTTVSGFSYAVNNLGQRVQVTTAGSAHGWSWGYDALGQVTKATNAANTDYNRAYAFDNIGNRTSATDGTATTVGYTPNDLNQYEEIDPGTPVNPDFDADGNLRADAGINIMGYGLKFEWDAENRITAVRKDVQGSPLLATYTYDYLGRRIRKTTTSSALQGVADIAYVYDGFNVVAEYTLTTEGSSVSEALLQAYTWGLDLSGSMQGAGGVGGLLCIHRSPGINNNTRTWGATFYPTYDGNGNISEYLDKDGVEVAHFEYDPFGRIVLSTGTPGIFTYRFSTKPQDKETGLYYYGYRYYDPMTGRWPSRDPIEEEGGANLYGFVGNDGVNSIDILGYFEWIEYGSLAASATVSPGPIYFTLAGAAHYYEDATGTCCKKLQFKGDLTWGGGASARAKIKVGWFVHATAAIKATIGIADVTHQVDFEVIWNCLDQRINSSGGRIDIINTHLGFFGEAEAQVYVQLGKYKYGIENARIQLNLNGNVKSWAMINLDRKEAVVYAQATAKFGAELGWRDKTWNHNILEDLDTKEQEMGRFKW